MVEDNMTNEELIEMEKGLKAEQEAGEDYKQWKNENQGW